MTTHREKIVQELRTRLALEFPDSQIERGFQQEEVNSYNIFYILELPEVSVPLRGEPNERFVKGLERRGWTLRTLPLSISYWIQADPKEIYVAANEMLDKISDAVEVDELFCNEEGNLVVKYWLDAVTFVVYDKGVLDVELVYMFQYTREAKWVKRPFRPNTGSKTDNI
jgi:hypothetical protein